MAIMPGYTDLGTINDIAPPRLYLGPNSLASPAATSVSDLPLASYPVQGYSLPAGASSSVGGALGDSSVASLPSVAPEVAALTPEVAATTPTIGASTVPGWLSAGSGASGILGKALGPLGIGVSGILAGNALSHTGLGNDIINAGRGQDVPWYASAIQKAMPITAIAGGINSLLGGDHQQHTDSTVDSLTSSGDTLDRSALTADALHNKLANLHLSPDTYAQFVQDFNDNTAVLEAAGVPHDQAMAQSNAAFFGSTDKDRKVTPGKAADYLKQDRAAQQAATTTTPEQDLNTNLSALVGLIAQHAPQYLKPMAQTQAWYNSTAPGMLGAQPPSLQGLAGNEVAQRSADLNNISAATFQSQLNTPALYGLKTNLALQQAVSQAAIDKAFQARMTKYDVNQAVKQATGGSAPSSGNLQSLIAANTAKP